MKRIGLIDFYSKLRRFKHHVIKLQAHVFALTPIPNNPREFHHPCCIMTEALGLDNNIAFCESVNKEIANVYLRDIRFDIKGFQELCSRIFD